MLNPTKHQDGNKFTGGRREFLMHLFLISGAILPAAAGCVSDSAMQLPVAALSSVTKLIPTGASALDQPDNLIVQRSLPQSASLPQLANSNKTFSMLQIVGKPSVKAIDAETIRQLASAAQEENPFVSSVVLEESPTATFIESKPTIVEQASAVELETVPLGSADQGESQLATGAVPQSFSDVQIDSPVVLSEVGNQTIDLASALAMSGGNALTIQLARQRTVQAHADLVSAKARWLPSLQAGIGWNKHDGRIQATTVA